MKVERRKSRFNILIVEDDREMFNTIKEALTETNYKLYCVDTAQEALRLIKEGYFIAVIMELRLRDMDGIELIRRLIKQDNKVNIIALTAYSFTDSAVEAMREGAYAYLMKPLNKEELKLVLQRSIEKAFLLIQAGKRKYYQDLSIIDAVTGIYNHRHFHEMMDWSISHIRRFPQSFSLFMIDIDDFKKYNDKHGHVQGDKVLNAAAQLFVDCTRDTDMVFRYGGEEFAIILAQTDQAGAQRVSDRLLSTVRRQLPVTISIGLATFPSHAQSKPELIVRADKALYRAKREGKNRLCIFDEKIDK